MPTLQEVAEKKIQEQVGSNAQLLGYLEHQIDLVSQLVKDIADSIPEANRTTGMTERLVQLEAVLTQSSIDFDNLASPFENYKIPMTVATKGKLRPLQRQYLTAKLKEEGIL